MCEYGHVFGNVVPGLGSISRIEYTSDYKGKSLCGYKYGHRFPTDGSRNELSVWSYFIILIDHLGKDCWIS